MRPVYVNGFAVRTQAAWQERFPFLADAAKIMPRFIFFHDRSGYFPNEIGAKTLHPIPKPVETGNSFGDLLQRLTDEFLARCLDQGKRLYLCYSGGIDSTAVACAILKSDHLARMKAAKLLYVGMTSDSIAENPRFYPDYVSKHFEITLLDYSRMADARYILTGGEYGDQLVGSL